MKSVLVSVIVPCYNYGHFLPETLDSIKNQTLQDWECIIVDDGSRDNTGIVAEKYCNEDCRFKYIYQENKGLSNARNTGLKIISGEYIQLLDADDLIESNKLQAQSDFLNCNSIFDIVFTNSSFFIVDQQNISKYYSTSDPFLVTTSVKEIQNAFLKDLIVNNKLLVCAPLFRRTLLKSIGNFDETLTSCEDWDFWLRAANKDHKFCYVKPNTSKALIRQHAISMRANTWKMFYNALIVRKKISSFILISELRKANKIGITNDIKTLLYEIPSIVNENKQLRLAKIDTILKVHGKLKLKIFKFFIHILPNNYYMKAVWIFYETVFNVIKRKMK